MMFLIKLAGADAARATTKCEAHYLLNVDN